MRALCCRHEQTSENDWTTGALRIFLCALVCSWCCAVLEEEQVHDHHHLPTHWQAAVIYLVVFTSAASQSLHPDRPSATNGITRAQPPVSESKFANRLSSYTRRTVSNLVGRISGIPLAIFRTICLPTNLTLCNGWFIQAHVDESHMHYTILFFKSISHPSAPAPASVTHPVINNNFLA